MKNPLPSTLYPLPCVLFIHAAKREETFLLLVKEGKIAARVRPKFAQGKTADLLKHTHALLKKKNILPKQLQGIVVLSGPGQFSFLRSSIIIANTFAWVLNIPIVDIYGEDFSSEEEFIALGCKKLLKAKKIGMPIVPRYGKEPNITVAKKKI